MKVKLLAIILLVTLSLSGCSGYEISTKLVSDAIVITPEKLILVTDTVKEPKLYEVDYVKFDTSLKEIKK